MGSPPFVHTTYRSTLSPDTSYMAELGAWGVVQECLDAYHQRRSATGGATGAGSPLELPRVVSLLPEAGPSLLSAYETRAENEDSVAIRMAAGGVGCG